METKYTITKNGVDDYSLKYKDTEIKLHSTVSIAEKIQDTVNQARTKLIIDLSSQGKTIKDLTKETIVDGKTIVDTSSIDALENLYIEKEYSLVFDKCIEEMTGKSFYQLISEIGLTTEEESVKFGEDLGNILSGNFPS